MWKGDTYECVLYVKKYIMIKCATRKCDLKCAAIAMWYMWKCADCKNVLSINKYYLKSEKVLLEKMCYMLKCENMV